MTTEEDEKESYDFARWTETRDRIVTEVLNTAGVVLVGEQTEAEAAEAIRHTISQAYRSGYRDAMQSMRERREGR